MKRANGASRVVTLDLNEEVIDQYVADLLDFVPRAAARFLKFHGDGRERIEAVRTKECVSP